MMVLCQIGVFLQTHATVLLAFTFFESFYKMFSVFADENIYTLFHFCPTYYYSLFLKRFPFDSSFTRLEKKNHFMVVLFGIHTNLFLPD